MSVITKKRPGITMTHQVFRINALFAKESMLPHDKVSIGSPNPKKLRVDSMIMQLLILDIIMNIMVGKKFGIK